MTHQLLRTLIFECVLIEDSSGNIKRILGLSTQNAKEFAGMYGKNAFLNALVVKKAFEDPENREQTGIDDFDEFMTAYYEYDMTNFHEKIINTLTKHREISTQDLMKLSYQEIINLVRKLSDDDIDVDSLLSKAVLKFPNGFFWIELISADEKEQEGVLMKHCGRDESDGVEMFSLRDKNGRPHVTLSIAGLDNVVSQISGKANTTPQKRYWPMIVAFVEERGCLISDELASMESKDSKLIAYLVKNLTAYQKR